MSEDHPHKRRPIFPLMTRCSVCRSWWSRSEEEIAATASDGAVTATCPCGGLLELVDMVAHMATVPYQRAGSSPASSTSEQMTPKDARDVVRSKGMCGDVSSSPGSVCILEIGHNDGVHELAWTVEARVEPDPCSRDARESITRHVVCRGGVSFEAGGPVWAQWLCDVLNREQQIPPPRSP